MPDLLLLLALVLVCMIPLGEYIARVYSGERVFLTPMLGWLERGIYRLARVNPGEEMRWRSYAMALLSFSLFGFLFLFILLSVQHVLPFNPQHLPALRGDLAFNIAVSFLTNTNWQSYGGETTLSYFSQMAGLTVQNFLSAGCGMAVAAAFFRAFARRKCDTIGNFWADLARGILYILLPLAVIWALLLASQGVVQTLVPASQEIAVGPVASQVAIKQLGSNGGGFFNANSAHPFENPTPFSNFLEMLAILLLPTAFIYAFGAMVGDRRQGWTIFTAMTIIFLPLLALMLWQEQNISPLLAQFPLDATAGNMEGKETRFGADISAFWAAATTATSNGSVNSMHDSYMPLSGMVPLLLILFSEVIYGGVGSGMVSMLAYVITTVFIAGLMIGRTPEYLGKKLGVFEIKMAALIFLVPAMLTLVGAGIAVSSEAGRAAVHNPGAHGFSEVMYAVASAANNNGSAFAGIGANNAFYNTLLGVLMFFGRFLVLTAALALAGAIAARNTVPVSAGTLHTHGPLFAVMLVKIVIVLGILGFAPVFALGPIAEHLQLFGAAP